MQHLETPLVLLQTHTLDNTFFFFLFENFLKRPFWNNTGEQDSGSRN